MSTAILRVENITKYFNDINKFKVLDDLSLEIPRGEFVSIVGKSGSGKSTLLYVLSTMDRDYEGTMYFENTKLTGMQVDELAEFRSENIGFVFQFHYLLSKFSVLDNVMMPALKLGRYSKKEIEQHAYEKLQLLEIDSLAHKASENLSGGQQQRVAIARALINNPKIIMADEPTGNLDSANASNVFSLFRKIVDTQKQTIITVTHDKEFARMSDRTIEMKDGKIISEQENSNR